MPQTEEPVLYDEISGELGTHVGTDPAAIEEEPPPKQRVDYPKYVNQLAKYPRTVWSTGEGRRAGLAQGAEQGANKVACRSPRPFHG